jgi:hypothetical protein
VPKVTSQPCTTLPYLLNVILIEDYTLGYSSFFSGLVGSFSTVQIA